jgi:hypothetical protein
VVSSLLALPWSPRAAQAALLQAATRCDGSDRCCGTIEDVKTPSAIPVSVGIAIEGIHNLDERTGGWDVARRGDCGPSMGTAFELYATSTAVEPRVETTAARR